MGHKNPDTDSICSAIAYAYLKSRTDDSCSYVAARAGQVSAETQYVLDYFKMEQPLFLDNIGTRVKDMEIRGGARGQKPYFREKRLDPDAGPECFYAAHYR